MILVVIQLILFFQTHLSSVIFGFKALEASSRIDS